MIALYMLSLSMVVSVAHSQQRSDSIKWEIPEMNSLYLKFHAAPISVMKSFTICFIHPGHESSFCSVYLYCIYYPSVIHLVAVSIIRSPVMLPQCLCSNNPNPEPNPMSRLDSIHLQRHLITETLHHLTL
jgi:hypothetical protein